jgi:hypothetical protein
MELNLFSMLSLGFPAVLTQFVVNLWNKFTEEAVACDSLNGFKNRHDKYLKGSGFT